VEPGQRIGEYIIEASLGGGGMARVFRCRHAVLETVHAMKVLDAEFRTNVEIRQRFLTEAKIQAKHLQHPNIVRVTNIVATAEAAALIMDLVEGGSLEEHLSTLQRPMSSDAFLTLAAPILDAMAHAHDAGIIHRDLKPANILLARKGDRLVPVIADFGIAKVTDPTVSKKSTHHEARMGTLGYMSPEQVRKAKDVTARSDIFSLGAMFYEMLTGRSPFETDPHVSEYDVMDRIVHGRYDPIEKHADPRLEPRIIAAVKRALATEPADRFADCRAFSAALTGGAPIPAPVPTPARAAGGRTMVVGLAVAGALAIAGGVFLATRRAQPASAPRDAAVVAMIDAPAAVAPAVDAGATGAELLTARPPVDAAPAPPVDAPKPVVVVVPTPPASDRDRDGIPDARDRCPRVAGRPGAGGCPDGDDDGITDAADRCPRLADRSGDGDGCPGSDADGDGISNGKDACPDRPETKNLFNDLDGCPDHR
jgi:serine/threonine-protein kinase